MHQGLRLRRAGIEDAPSVPEDLEDVSVVGGPLVVPGDEAGVEAEVLHADVLFDADGEAVKGADRTLMLGEVGIEVFSTRKSVVGEELRDAVGLL